MVDIDEIKRSKQQIANKRTEIVKKSQEIEEIDETQLQIEITANTLYMEDVDTQIYQIDMIRGLVIKKDGRQYR